MLLQGQKPVDEGSGSLSYVACSRPCVLDKPLDNLSVGQGRDDKGKAGNAVGNELLEYGSNCWHID